MKSSRVPAKTTVARGATPPRASSAVERYAQIFTPEALSGRRRVAPRAHGTDPCPATAPEQPGCAWCQGVIPHLHGSVLYEAGQELF